ncbi:MAG: DUF1207 domain-containing protein [Melioribacteraceae bacterium]|nr:DUF1207 domain-containing protein [Melioribacteraceae bacterium]
MKSFRKIGLIIILVSVCITVLPQSKTGLFPGGLMIQPLTANYLEPKLGFLFNLSDENLRLEIGNSLDIYRAHLSYKEFYSIGADLFTYSRLRSEKKFKFPVETIDYLFGLNFGYLNSKDEYSYGARLRLSHISAHLVDGLYNNVEASWMENRNPFVYSKELIEFITFIYYKGLRIYGGITYNYHIEPGYLGNDNYQLGFDYFYGELLSEYITPFIAYDLRISNLIEYTTNHSFNAGVKFGRKDGQGFSIYFHYYNGKSIHGEFYDVNKSYMSLGFNLDL